MAGVCIVGGGGFIGTNLARLLLAGGERVTAYGRPPRWPEALHGCRLVEGELGDGDRLAEALAGCDRLYHLVGPVALLTEESRRAENLQHHVGGTLSLFDAALAAGVERVIFVSSGGAVYGVPARLPIPEASDPWPISSYGVAKLAIERYLHVYRHQHGLDYRIARLGNPFGPFQHPGKGQGAVAALIDAALGGRTFPLMGDGAVVRDYLYIDDACEALRRLATHHGEARVFNVGSGRGVSLTEMIALVEAAVGKPVRVASAPPRPVDVPENVLDVRRAREQLGWRAETPIEAGLARTARWLDEWSARGE